MDSDLKLSLDRLTWQELDGEAVVLDLASSTYFTLNRTGTYLITLLREPRSETELVDALAEKCGRNGPDVASDVAAFVEELRQRGLISP